MIRALITLGIVVLMTSCATSPTGHSQLQFFPEEQMAEMGQAAYQEVKQKTPTSDNPRLTHYVQCVANAVTRVVAPNTDWEVTLFQDNAANAFALPGGKIGVYTGLLHVAKNQDQLAAVIGHEIGHVQAHHSNARVSTAYATQAGLTAVQILTGATGAEQQQLMGLLGLGAQVGVLLPYNRAQESEADLLGLEYMARAGFDPQESIKLWQNMAQAGGNQPPEFLSTHPSHETRIEQLEKHMAKAQTLYQQARAQGRRPNCG